MSTDFRALCVELTEQVQRAISDHGLCLDASDALMHRARAALAAVPKGGPTEQEADELCCEHGFHYEDDETLAILVEIIRAAVARYGTPAPVLVADVHYEFIVSDAETDEPQAGGEAPTLEEARREGEHYLAMYGEDGPMRLELRRVEVLPMPEAQP